MGLPRRKADGLHRAVADTFVTVFAVGFFQSQDLVHRLHPHLPFAFSTRYYHIRSMISMSPQSCFQPFPPPSEHNKKALNSEESSAFCLELLGFHKHSRIESFNTYRILFASESRLASSPGSKRFVYHSSGIRSTRSSSSRNNWLQQYFSAEKQAVMLTSNTPACFSVTIPPQKEHPEWHSAGPPAVLPAAFSAAAERSHRHCAFHCLRSG